ncbi:hypothetical protein GCM10009000_009560 [Halobacterium noricense]|uniref:Uncharacterized protein n=1 Tax=Haladaptatus pallidirubidus TaxID=1008152 RepID=A0AAV3UD86_9EURY
METHPETGDAGEGREDEGVDDHAGNIGSERDEQKNPEHNPDATETPLSDGLEEYGTDFGSGQSIATIQKYETGNADQSRDCQGLVEQYILRYRHESPTDGGRDVQSTESEYDTSPVIFGEFP